MPWGRGGAGNFEQSQKKALSSPSSSSTIIGTGRQYSPADGAPSSAPSIQPQSEQPPYALKGRGGAGNYYSPVSLMQTGIFAHSSSKNPDSTLTSNPAAPTDPNAPKSHAYGGRGGAGNYLYQQEDTEAARRQEEKKRQGESVKLQVKEDIELGLMRPEKAYVVGRDSGAQAQQEDEEETRARAMMEERVTLEEIALR